MLLVRLSLKDYNMPIPRFFYWQRDRAPEEAQRRRLAEITALQNADIARQRGAIQAEREQADITKVADRMEKLRALQAVIAAENPGYTPEEVNRRAEYELNLHSSSGLGKETAGNLATTAIEKFNRAQAEGMQPLAGTLGRERVGFDLNTIRAGNEEANLRGATARRRFATAPEREAAADIAVTNAANFDAARSSAMLPYAGQLAETEAKSGISRNINEAAKSTYDTAVLDKRDKDLEAEAINAGFSAAREQARLLQSTGGLVGGGVNILDPLIISGDPNIRALITSVLTNRMQNAPPAGVTNTNALPTRGPLFNLNDLRFRKPY